MGSSIFNAESRYISLLFDRQLNHYRYFDFGPDKYLIRVAWWEVLEKKENNNFMQMSKEIEDFVKYWDLDNKCVNVCVCCVCKVLAITFPAMVS